MTEVSSFLGNLRPEFSTGSGLDGWDELVAGFDDFSVEQTIAYQAPRVGRHRLCGFVLREADTGEPAVAVLLARAIVPFLRRGVAFVKFGPLWRRRGRPISHDVLIAGLAALRAEFSTRQKLLVRLFPPPDPEYEDEWSSALAVAGYRRRDHDPSPERYLVDLSLSEKEQLASLSKDWRSNLRKASPEIEVQEVDPKQSLYLFMGLYSAMFSRKQFRDLHNMGTVPEFVEAASPAMKVRMFLALQGGKPVAGTLVVGPGERIFVMYGASSDEALRLRAGYALRWWMVNQLRSSGSRWMDLGGTEEDSGLRNFKRGLIGKEGWIAILGAEHDSPGDALSSVTAVGVSAVRRVLQSRRG